MLAKFTYRLNLKFMECDFLSFWWLIATIFYEWSFHTNFSIFYHATKAMRDTILADTMVLNWKLNFRWQKRLKRNVTQACKPEQDRGNACGLCFMSALYQHQPC